MEKDIEDPKSGKQPDRTAPSAVPNQKSPKQLTDAQLEARREVQLTSLQQSWLIGSVAFLVIYLAVGDVVTTWRGGSGWVDAIKIFAKSYGALVLLVAGISSVLGIVLASYTTVTKAWGEYVLALFVVLAALWLWAGSYNGWRDILIGIFVFIVLFKFGKPLLDRISRRLAKLERWWRKKVLVDWLQGGTRSLANVEKVPLDSMGADAVGWLYASTKSPAGRPFYAALAWFLGTWVLASCADREFGPAWFTPNEPLAATAARFENISRPWADAWSRTPPQRLGVALSGGGFRAALLHAGVLSALSERGIPIAGLATVSGGSIIGGFYVAGGDPSDFRDAVAGGRFNLKREIIDFPNLLRLPCPAHIPIMDIKLLWWCSFSRVDVQAHLLDRVLFGGKRVAQLRQEREAGTPWWSSPPWWVIGATDLRHGEGVGLSVDGIFRRAHAMPGRGLHQTDLQRVPSDVTFEDLTAQETYGDKRIAELIAVSGAFPGAFGSTRFPISEDDSLQIVDGGITDNLGYSLLMSTLERAPNSPHEKEWALDMVLVSDGGMPLQEDKHIVGYTEFFRAMDVVYASSGILVKPNNLNKIWLSPRTIVSGQLSEDDFARVPAEIRKHRRVNTLPEFQADFETVRNVFLATSTLKDRFDESWLESLDRRFWHKDKLPSGNEAVDALFTLGQYLVYVNLPDICKGLKLQNDKCQRETMTSPGAKSHSVTR